MLVRLFAVILIGTTVFSCSAQNASFDSDPWPHGAMASVANPYATDAAIEILAEGGHVVDAAIAAHLVLGLVEPQSSGIGGGGFMLVFERAKKATTFYDGRETAPSEASADMFMQDAESMPYLQAWQSGKSVGVPGVVALYRKAHEQHGRLPWSRLFQPAIRLAETGFEVSPRLADMLLRVAKFTRLDENPGAADYFYPNGEALIAGQLRKNPEYARTLRALAEEGIGTFYGGALAEQIVAAAQAQPDPGSLQRSDLERYAVRVRPVVCGGFRALEICSASPPSSGAMQIMVPKLYDYLRGQASSGGKMQDFVDAQRLAYADRDHFFADPDWVDVPVEALLDQTYLRQRANARFAPDAVPKHGNPLGGTALGADTTQEPIGTTHLSLIDSEGNAVSFTATVESAFGSARWVGGFLLNNEMTDFARGYDAEMPLPANVIAGGKRPRSSMSPTMVFDESGELVLVTGSPGGNSIPAYVAKTILGIFDWQLTPQQAVDHPNIIARGSKVRVEIGVDGGAEVAANLKNLGYEVQEREGENSGIHLIQVTKDGLVGAADMRREGTVRSWKAQ